MVSQNSHTTAFIFGKKKIILLRRLRGAPVLESRHIHGIYISKTTPITSFQRRAHESLPRQSIRTALVQKQNFILTIRFQVVAFFVLAVFLVVIFSSGNTQSKLQFQTSAQTRNSRQLRFHPPGIFLNAINGR